MLDCNERKKRDQGTKYKRYFFLYHLLYPLQWRSSHQLCLHGTLEGTFLARGLQILFDQNQPTNFL